MLNYIAEKETRPSDGIPIRLPGESTGMAESIPSDTIRELLGSSEVFHSAINELVLRHLSEVSHERLTYTQLRLLQLFSITDDHSVSDVATFLDVSNAAASRAVDWLVRHRYVRRTQRPSDRRAVKLALTPTGRRMLESFEDEFLKVVREMIGDVSAECVTRTVEILDRMSVHLARQLDAEGGICFRCGLHFRKQCPLQTDGQTKCHRQLRSFKDSGDEEARVGPSE